MDAWFDRGEYARSRGDGVLGRTLYDFESIGSTNSWLLGHAAALPHGTAAVAAIQTAGRGRRGRVWTSPEAAASARGASLALSVLLRGLPRERLALLPLCCAVAVCDACGTLATAEPGIKWPNDIVFRGRKLCGILCEARPLPDGGSAVCGFGLNLTQDAADFERAGLPWAVSLREASGRAVSPAAAAGTLLAALEKRFSTASAEQILRAYGMRCVTLGRPVRYTGTGENAEERTGTAVGLAPDGALLVASGGETLVLHAGDVSVRGVYGYA